MRIARVFPRRTRATPTDDLAFVGPPGLFPPEVDEVHISVTFTWDLPEAERMERAWKSVAPVTVGGPATGMRGEAFTPGMYLKEGYVIFSRGCPNHCWFCDVWKREGDTRELPINDGWNVLDDNLLACSEVHIRTVFKRLKRQDHATEFTGGLEAKRLKQWHCDLLSDLKPKQMFFAYDTPDDLLPLQRAGQMLLASGFTPQSHRLRCYVLVGYPRDTFELAEIRLRQTIEAGFMPMAMLWRDRSGHYSGGWKSFQRQWVRPHIVGGAYALQRV